MNKMQKQVRQWHRYFNVPVSQQPIFPSQERRDLRLALIQEEFDELQTGIFTENIYKVADALADLLYVTYGCAIEFGLDMEPIFDEVQKSNMSKLGPGGKPIYRPDGKVLKGPHFKEPKIKEVVDVQSRPRVHKTTRNDAVQDGGRLDTSR